MWVQFFQFNGYTFYGYTIYSYVGTLFVSTENATITLHIDECYLRYTLNTKPKLRNVNNTMMSFEKKISSLPSKE